MERLTMGYATHEQDQFFSVLLCKAYHHLWPGLELEADLNGDRYRPQADIDQRQN
jgi:hypothetical protein